MVDKKSIKFRFQDGFKYLLVVAYWFTKYTLLCLIKDATTNNVIKYLKIKLFFFMRYQGSLHLLTVLHSQVKRLNICEENLLHS